MALLSRRHKKKFGKVPLRKLSKHPSAGCRQHLSTAQLVERTQEDRVRRKAKKSEQRES